MLKFLRDGAKTFRAGGIAMLVAYAVPRRVAYWAAIRVCVHATTGIYSDQVVPALLATDALKRWDMP